jgi:hypothetical protein
METVKFRIDGKVVVVRPSMRNHPYITANNYIRVEQDDQPDEIILMESTILHAARLARAQEQRDQIAKWSEMQRRRDALEAKERGWWCIEDVLLIRATIRELAKVLRNSGNEEVEHKPKKKPGRPLNTGYATQDKLLIEKARNSLWKNEAKSLLEAIEKVADEAPGKGTQASKIKRLLSR